MFDKLVILILFYNNYAFSIILLLTSNCFVTQKRRTYESTKCDKTQQHQQQNEHEVVVLEEGYYSSVTPPVYSKATTINNDSHTAIGNQVESVKTTDRDSMIESDRYCGVYNYPAAIMTEENTAITIRLESVEPSDDQKEIITMNDNDAYNLVGSPDCRSISADTAVSQRRNSVQTAVSLIDEEDVLSDNPLYQSYSDITGSTTQLLSKSNYDIDDGVFLQPNKAYAVTNIV